MNQFWNTIWAIRPNAEWTTMPLFTTLVVLTLVVAIICSFPIKRIPLWLKSQLATWGWTTSIVAAILWFFRFGQVPYLGMEGWLWMWFIVAITWLIVIAVLLLKQQKSPEAEISVIESYKAQFLPKPKQKTDKPKKKR